MDKTIDYYMGLPYTIEMVPGLESGWVVSVRELPGCISQGDSPQNAVDMIREAMCGWLEIALEDGIPIPEPRPAETFSGKFVVRVTRSLHRDLVDAAERDGVSLNQYVSTTLARAVGEQAAAPDALLRTEQPAHLSKESRPQSVSSPKRTGRKPRPEPLPVASSHYVIPPATGVVTLADRDAGQPAPVDPLRD